MCSKIGSVGCWGRIWEKKGVKYDQNASYKILRELRALIFLKVCHGAIHKNTINLLFILKLKLPQYCVLVHKVPKRKYFGGYNKK